MNQEPTSDPGQVILIDKPLNWTSFDVVKKLRWGGKFKKIGHAGTLDPLATGLLILCTGKMTKQIDQYQAQEKEYTGTLVLGKTTPPLIWKRTSTPNSTPLPSRPGRCRQPPNNSPALLTRFRRFTRLSG